MKVSEYKKISSLFDKEFEEMNSDNSMGDRKSCILTLNYPSGASCFFVWGKDKANKLKDFVSSGKLKEAS